MLNVSIFLAVNVEWWLPVLSIVMIPPSSLFCAGHAINAPRRCHAMCGEDKVGERLTKFVRGVGAEKEGTS